KIAGPGNGVLLLRAGPVFALPGAAEGKQYLVLNPGGNPPGVSVQQTFDTRPGATYEVAFQIGRTGNETFTAKLAAEVTSPSGAVLGSLVAVAPPTADSWGPVQQFYFVANTNSVILTLSDASLPQDILVTDLILDNVRVTEVAARAPFQKRSDHVLEQVALLENGNWLGTGYAGVYLSADQGVTWTKTAFPSQGRPGLGIATRSVVGGGLTFVGAIDDGIWLSRDHGTNWTFTGPVASSFGTGIGRMAYNGTDYVAGYGGWPRGLYRWNGTGWDNTLAGTDGLSVLAAGNGRFLAGMLGGGVVSSDDGGRTWRNRHPEFQLLVRTANAVLGVGTPSGVVRRSDDNGDTWREEGSAVPAASMGYVDQPAVYGGALYVPVHGSGIWLRRPDLTWTRVLTNSGFCSVHVVGPSLVVASKEGVFQLKDESAFARILAQPQSLTANLGDTATFAVVATNATTFQWFKDGTPLPGATNATLTLANVQPPRIGDYQFVAGNGFGSVTSSMASLTIPGVNAAAWRGLVAYYPMDGTIQDASPNNGSGSMSRGEYGLDRFGKATASLLLKTNNDVVLNIAQGILPTGSADRTFSMWIKPDPSKIYSQEYFQVLIYGNDSLPGGALTMFIQNNTFNLNPFPLPGDHRILAQRSSRLWYGGWHHLKWVLRAAERRAECYLDGVQVPDGSFGFPGSHVINTIHTPVRIGSWHPEAPSTQQFYGGIDDVRIYSRALSRADVVALYHSELSPIPTIGRQPQPVMTDLGSTVSMSTSATNAMSFQWLKDGTPLPGATNATLILTNVQPSRIGDYQVVAGNGFGSVTSTVATLSINGVNPGIWKGLVGYYPLDGNPQDASANGNDLTSRGAPSYSSVDRFGRIGASVGLNGSGDYFILDRP
ncbi:MAG: LamG-like jellyroll fold domain-containing protein, partial [Verrucomicrobiota bacterium]